MNSPSNDPREPDAIEELLPWYAAGTLDPHEARRVEDALSRDPNLAHHFDLVREELAATVQFNETLGAPSSRAMGRLFASIDREPARPAAFSLNLAARIAALLTRLSPRTLAWSASAVALLLLLQAGLIAGIMLNGPAGGEYRTASAPSGPQGNAANALIRFAPSANVADTTEFLEQNKISIVSGPAPGGLYRVHVATDAKADVGALLTQLGQDKVVSFIAPTE